MTGDLQDASQQRGNNCRWIDTHAHLDMISDYFDAKACGELEGIITISTHKGNAETLKIFCQNGSDISPWIRRTVGIHPGYITPGELELGWLSEAASEDNVVAIGEIGLDSLVANKVPLSIQEKVFRAQLAVAEKVRRPVILHIRGEVEGLVMSVLREYNVTGVAHCYTGSSVLADFLLEKGFCIGVAGIVTYRNGESVRTVAAHIPDDRILIETDSPYLVPEPLRKRVNKNIPSYIREVGEAVAKLRGVSAEVLSAQVRRNVGRVFLGSD